MGQPVVGYPVVGWSSWDNKIACNGIVGHETFCHEIAGQMIMGHSTTAHRSPYHGISTARCSS